MFAVFDVLEVDERGKHLSMAAGGCQEAASKNLQKNLKTAST